MSQTQLSCQSARFPLGHLACPIERAASLIVAAAALLVVESENRDAYAIANCT
jgi:hypothetical protein